MPSRSKPLSEPSRLFDLPRELRDVIWMYALQDHRHEEKEPHATEVNAYFQLSDPQWRWGEYWGQEPTTRLLRVSKAISAEATTVLYTQFDFHVGPYKFAGKQDCRRFPGCLQLASRHLIRNITTVRLMNGHGSDTRPSTFESLVVDLPALSKVTIRAMCPEVVRYEDYENTEDKKRLAREATVKAALRVFQPFRSVKQVVAIVPKASWTLPPGYFDLPKLVKERINSGEW